MIRCWQLQAASYERLWELSFKNWSWPVEKGGNWRVCGFSNEVFGKDRWGDDPASGALNFWDIKIIFLWYATSSVHDGPARQIQLYWLTNTVVPHRRIMITWLQDMYPSWKETMADTNSPTKSKRKNHGDGFQIYPYPTTSPTKQT